MDGGGAYFYIWTDRSEDLKELIFLLLYSTCFALKFNTPIDVNGADL